MIQAKDLLDYRDNIIDAFKDGTFLSEHLKKSDGAAYNYVLKDVNKFIQEIRSMEEKINLSLFEDLFESSSPADYAKNLINTKNRDEQKEIVKEMENRISDLNDRIKKMSEKEKKDKNMDETLNIIKKFLITIKTLTNFLNLHQRLIKESQSQILTRVLQRQQN